MKTNLKTLLAPLVIAAFGMTIPGRAAAFDGLSANLAELYQITPDRSRSISPENFAGEKGKAGMATEGTGKHAASELGQGWKVSPSVVIKAGTTFTLGEIKGPGSIQQIWMTPTGNWRHSILRFYWDDEADPSVECPVGDFFACGLGRYCQINSLAVCVNPGSAFNCYWPMPFRKKARITLENLDDKNMTVYYQINYTLAKVPKTAGYFHAQFRHESLHDGKGVYTILDGVEGRGQYVGTYMAREGHSGGWWGEGEIKFYLDGDQEFPTICGTGTEDYFCGSYDFENSDTHLYQTFTTPYSGLAQVLPPEKIYVPGQKFGLYRWHITDPVRFSKNIKVTMQSLGWKEGGIYQKLDDEISSVAYWYQTEPHKTFRKLPSRTELDWH
jgi:D-arabinan exo alpha-(1,3)/(1,5)-arabinofuranosidase (non-reducing end)